MTSIGKIGYLVSHGTFLQLKTLKIIILDRAP